MGKNDMENITDAAIKTFVNDLFKKNNMGIQDFGSGLSIKYNHKVAETVRDIFIKKYKMIENRATKLASLVQEKYRDRDIPFHVILEKTKIFKNKYNLSDDEYFTFQRIYEQEFSDDYKKRINLPSNTNMMKLLGTTYTESSVAPFKLDDTNMKYLQEILKNFAMTKQLQTNIFLQSILYQGCMYLPHSTDPQVIKYKQSDEYGSFDYIHPILVALFLPKLKCIDEYFIHCNLSEVISNRYNNEPITNYANKQLIHNLSIDVNDIVCNNKSPLHDLLLRTEIQQQLWHCVFNMRQNKFYTKKCPGFLHSLTNCKLNKYDNPDLTYGKNDLTLLKRLFNAFAFKPTVVVTQKLNNSVHYNPYFRAFKPHAFKIPMINIRPGITELSNENVYRNENNETNNYDLPEEYKNKRIFDLSRCLDKKDIIRYANYDFHVNTNIMYSKLLVFYVDKRFTSIDFGFYKHPYMINNVPSPLYENFYELNTEIVTVTPIIIESHHQKYRLTSVICSETIEKKVSGKTKQYIIGSSAYISCYNNGDDDDNNSKESSECVYYKYNPLRVKKDGDHFLYKAYSGSSSDFLCGTGSSIYNTPHPNNLYNRYLSVHHSNTQRNLIISCLRTSNDVYKNVITALKSDISNELNAWKSAIDASVNGDGTSRPIDNNTEQTLYDKFIGSIDRLKNIVFGHFLKKDECDKAIPCCDLITLYLLFYFNRSPYKEDFESNNPPNLYTILKNYRSDKLKNTTIDGFPTVDLVIQRATNSLNALIVHIRGTNSADHGAHVDGEDMIKSLTVEVEYVNNRTHYNDIILGGMGNNANALLCRPTEATFGSFSDPDVKATQASRFGNSTVIPFFHVPSIFKELCEKMVVANDRADDINFRSLFYIKVMKYFVDMVANLYRQEIKSNNDAINEILQKPLVDTEGIVDKDKKNVSLYSNADYKEDILMKGCIFIYGLIDNEK